MLEQLIDQIEQANKAGLCLVALNSALIIPDVCGKAETPDVGVGERYERWFDENVAHHFLRDPFKTLRKNPSPEIQPKLDEVQAQYEADFHPIDQPFLIGEHAYWLRCKMLHEGKTRDERMKYLLVLTTTEQMTGNAVIKQGEMSAIQVDVQKFCEHVVEGCREWLKNKATAEPILSNLEELTKETPLSELLGGVTISFKDTGEVRGYS